MKVDRLISIIMILLESKNVSAKDLSERFEVSIRTIYRDIESINMAGVPIVSSPGVNGGFRIMDGYKVDKSQRRCCSRAGQSKKPLPTGQADAIELQSSQISIDLKPWMGNENLQPYLARIKTAFQKQTLLTFQYSDRKGQMSNRRIEPYKLVLKENHWYIQGYCLDKQDFRLFKLSRISNLEMLEITFIRREVPAAVSEFTDIMSKKERVIQLLIHESIKDRLLDYCSSEQMSAYGDDQFIIQFRRPM